MTLELYRWAVGGGLALALLGCDAEQRGADGPPANGDAAAPIQSNAANRAQPAESIIREDVLAETDTPPEPKVEAVEMTLNFAEAHGKLPADAASRLDNLLKQPVIARGGCIVIRGHTDSRGSDQQNLRASERRAELVAGYLVERGIAQERLRLIALGERRPIAPNANADGTDFPEGRARNRRVTVEAQLPAQGQGSCERSPK